MKLAYLAVAFLITGCVQAVAKDPAKPVEEAVQVVHLQSLESVLTLKGVSRVTLDLVNTDTPACRINVTFPGVILTGQPWPTCDEAFRELAKRTGAEKKEEDKK